MGGAGVRPRGGDLLGGLDLASQVEQRVPREVLAQLGELVGLLVVGVVVEQALELADEAHELGLLRVDVLELLHHHDDLVVLFLVVLDLVLAAGDLAFHDGVDEHLLGHGVAHDLGGDGVGEGATLGGVGGGLDLVEELDHLAVIGGEDLGDVPGRVCGGHVGLLPRWRLMCPTP